MKLLQRWEPRLWKSGLAGCIIRALYRVAWIRIRFVPGEERLWRALNRSEQVYAKTGQPKPSFFRDKNGLSCDLARFSTPERSRLGHGATPYPSESGLVEVNARLVRDAGSDVRHAPVKVPRRNYAHAQLTSALSSIGADLLAKNARYRIRQSFRG